jgi:glycosyltransferase involved in cell wall biosynthesis
VRLALVVDGPGFGGAQVYARYLLRYLPSAVQCDLLTVAEHAGALRAAAEARGELHVVRDIDGRADSRPVRRLLKALIPDAVHVNLVDPAGGIELIEAALDTAPAVATLHLTGAVPAWVLPRARAAYAALRHVAAVSREIAALLVRDLRVVPDHVSVVANGVDPVAVQQPVPREVPVIGGLGRLTPQKGFDVLVDATARLLARGRRLEVCIGGSGREAARLREQAGGLPVRLVGFQRDPANFLAGVDIFCLPSRLEALPLALLEAMSAGLACVCSDVGDVRATVGPAVRTVPPEDPQALADAVEYLLDNVVARNRLGGRAARRVREQFTAQRMVAQTWEVFATALQPVTATGPPRRAPR